MARTPRLTAARAHDLLDLDVETGVLRWRARPIRASSARTDRAWNGRYVGTIAGAAHNAGYIRISVEGEQFLAHRIVWLMVHGEWPSGEIDHQDLGRCNNRPVNLRDASPAQNKANRRARPNNLSGLKGVKSVRTLRGERFHARICGRHLGVFDTAAAAHGAYVEAASAHFGQFSRAA